MYKLEKIYLYTGLGFLIGFLTAWIIRSIKLMRLKKSIKSLGGFLESEKLRKEIFLKENTALYKMKKDDLEANETKILELKRINKRMDEDILLLQKSNEETEKLLEAGLPVVHSLKLQLIEANNALARYKSQVERIEVDKN